MERQSEKYIDPVGKPTQDNFLQSILSWVLESGARLKPFQVVLYIFYLGKIPGLRKMIPWLNHKKNSITYLPVNKSLENIVNNTMPVQVIHDFINKASTHVIMDKCGCRMLSDCKNHTHDIGCLFMGDTAQLLPHGVSRYVTREEAHEHVRNGVRNGLVPMSGKVSIDNFIYMTPDRKKLLSVCFCCPCCCILTSYKHVPGPYLDGIIRPMEGLVIEVTGDCVGCKTCVCTCPFDAIEIVNGQAIHTSSCRGCGRCESHCPHNAVKLNLDNMDFVETVKSRINSYVDF